MPLRSQGSTPQTPQPAVAQELLGSQAALRAHLLDLQTRLNVLNAQRNVLVERSRSDIPVVREDAAKALLNLDLDQASVRAQVASLQTQLTQGDGGAGTLVPPPPPPPNNPIIDPDAVTAVFVMTALAILVPLSIGIARRMWRRPPERSAGELEDKLSPRLDRLEHAVDAIAIEVERISEAQRFVAKVLTERPPIVQAASTQPSSDAAALGDAKPFLALGAGPMEPIRAAERQAVKQTVTPH